MFKILLWPVALSVVFVLSLFALLPSPPTIRERLLELAPGQRETKMELSKDIERVELFGASKPVQVTLHAPPGRVFKNNERSTFSFTTDVGQRHNWTFTYLDANTNQEAGSTTFRLTTLSARSDIAKMNEQREYSGKYKTHVHSFYLFTVAANQTNMLINIGDYRNPGVAYFHASGQTPAFEVVLQAPPGETFVWPANATHFETAMEYQPAPGNTRKQTQVRVPANAIMRTARYWLTDINGFLYYRDVGVQYASPQVVTNAPAPRH